MALPPLASLRLVQTANALPAEPADWRALDAICEAFAAATGWPLRMFDADAESNSTQLVWSAPVSPGVGTTPGHLRLGLFQSDAADGGSAALLADSIAAIWRELAATRKALWEREAELAAGVPLAVRAEPAASLASRLQAILGGAAQVVDGHAAALYLLDAGTTDLKLRASWGLPHAQLAEPARPLRGALADLEALLGRAVVLSDRTLHDYWRPPQDCGAAVCVPVLGSSFPLGTMWAFAPEAREFSDRDTNLLEIVAGRLACELERATLEQASLAQAELKRELGSCSAGFTSPAPPLLRGWDVGGCAVRKARSADSLPPTAFVDWFAGDRARLHVVLSAAQDTGVWGAMTSATLRGALRAAAASYEDGRSLLTAGNEVLWATSAGDARASAAHLVLDPASLQCLWSSAGQTRLFALRPGEEGRELASASAEPVSPNRKANRRTAGFATPKQISAKPPAPLGASDELLLIPRAFAVQPGEWLVAITGGGELPVSASPHARLAESLTAHPHAKARELAEIVAEDLFGAQPPADAAVVALQARPQ